MKTPLGAALCLLSVFQAAAAHAARDGWRGDNLARIEHMIRSLGKGGAAYDARHKPVAVFDWDNTVVKNDIGDARELRLVIDRNKPELLCHGLHDADGNWLVNPMFIRPKAPKAEAYRCGSYGIPDQRD